MSVCYNKTTKACFKTSKGKRHSNKSVLKVLPNNILNIQNFSCSQSCFVHHIRHTHFRFVSYKPSLGICSPSKVIYPKYSKHWPYTVAHTMDCVCSKILNRGLNHGLFLSLFKLIPCHIHWIVFVLAYLNFIFEF